MSVLCLAGMLSGVGVEHAKSSKISSLTFFRFRFQCLDLGNYNFCLPLSALVRLCRAVRQL